MRQLPAPAGRRTDSAPFGGHGPSLPVRLPARPARAAAHRSVDESVGEDYGVGTRQKLELAYRARRAQRRSIPTASTFLEHLAMVEAILRIPASVEGVVVECGCYKGGSTASLSLACRLAGRRLMVFDSFAGLPEPEAGDAVHHVLRDQTSHSYERGAFTGSVAEVRRNVARYGAVEVCDFVPGYFEDTLPDFSEPCAFAFVDVDLKESLKTCLVHLWPQLAQGCSVWTHEAHHAETPIGFAVKDPSLVRVVEQDWVAASTS